MTKKYKDVQYYVPVPLTRLINDPVSGQLRSVLWLLLRDTCGRTEKYLMTHISRYHCVLDLLYTHWIGQDRITEAGIKIKANRHAFRRLRIVKLRGHLGARYVSPQPIDGKDTNGILDDLQELGIIEYNDDPEAQPVQGVQCGSWRLTEEHRLARKVKHDIGNDSLLAKENRLRRERVVSNETLLGALGRHVADVEIDYEAALAAVTVLVLATYQVATLDDAYAFHRDCVEPYILNRHSGRDERPKHPDAKGYTSKGRRQKWESWLILHQTGRYAGTFEQYLEDWRATVTVRQQQRALVTIDAYEADERTATRIVTGDHIFEVDDYGRLHTTITSMSKRLRPHCWFGSRPGSKLINLDIANSQPLFIALVVLRKYGTLAACPTDVVHFVLLCRSGEFYQHLMASLKIPADERDAFKSKIFEVFFGRGGHQTETAKAFARLFPSVYLFLQSMKGEDAQDPDAAVSEKAYGKPARFAQGIESDTIIRDIGLQLVRAGVTFLTIHDSIVCPACQAKLVERVMRRVFKRLFDIELTINNTQFAPSRSSVLWAQQRVEEARRLELIEWEEHARWEAAYEVLAEAEAETFKYVPSRASTLSEEEGQEWLSHADIVEAIAEAVSAAASNGTRLFHLPTFGEQLYCFDGEGYLCRAA